MSRWFAGGAALLFFLVLTVGVFATNLAKLDRETLGRADDLDTRDNLWNLWWVGEAVSRGRWPWHTDLLFHPRGTPLLFHSLTPLNGLMALPLAGLGEERLLNLMYVVGYPAAGWFGWLLAGELTRAAWARVLLGTLLTLAPFHVSHTAVHLNFATVQFVPLFLWTLLRGLRVGGFRAGVLGGFALTACALADLHFGLFAGLLALPFFLLGRFDPSVANPPDAASGGSSPPLAGKDAVARVAGRSARNRFRLGMTLTALALLGPLAAAIILERSSHRYSTGHESGAYSADLLLPLVPGQRSAWASLSKPIWSTFTGNAEENAGGLGLVTLFGLGIAFGVGPRGARVWALLALALLTLSFGPELRVLGQRTGLPLPYGWLERTVPALAILGTPVRFIFAAQTAAAIAAVLAWDHLLRERATAAASSPENAGHRSTRTGRRASVGWILVALAVLEFWPAPFPTADLRLSESDQAALLRIRGEPGDFAVLEVPADLSAAGKRLQIVFRRPLVGGFMSRYRQAELDELSNAPVLGSLYGLRDLEDRDRPVREKRRELDRRRIRFVLSLKPLPKRLVDDLMLTREYSGRSFTVYRNPSG
jgi:hypothetical protein